MYLSSKLRAFTLLECLVALLVIAGSVQVYQPMLYNVKASTISQNNQIVTIQVTLKNGLQRSFVYAFEKTG